MLLYYPHRNHWEDLFQGKQGEDKWWWPLYHKTIEAGKKMILLGFEGVDNLKAFKTEFGPKLKHFMISIQAESLSQADHILDLAS